MHWNRASWKNSPDLGELSNIIRLPNTPLDHSEIEFRLRPKTGMNVKPVLGLLRPVSAVKRVLIFGVKLSYGDRI